MHGVVHPDGANIGSQGSLGQDLAHGLLSTDLLGTALGRHYDHHDDRAVHTRDQLGGAVLVQVAQDAHVVLDGEVPTQDAAVVDVEVAHRGLLPGGAPAVA